MFNEEMLQSPFLDFQTTTTSDVIDGTFTLAAAFMVAVIANKISANLMGDTKTMRIEETIEEPRKKAPIENFSREKISKKASAKKQNPLKFK